MLLEYFFAVIAIVELMLQKWDITALLLFGWCGLFWPIVG
jgi:hypothetical protein